MSVELARYLDLLGVEPEEPSLPALARLVRAQLITCPFENISKLFRAHCLGRRDLPSLVEHLDGIALHRLGGTCYANNYYLCRLLRHLGYTADLCGADMLQPDVHAVIRVTLSGRRYLVDGGYAAPFYGPLALDTEAPIRIPWGRDTFILQPRDERGWSCVEHHREGRPIHGYTINPQPRDIHHFAAVIRDSFQETSTFMNTARLERFFAGYSVAIQSQSLRIARPSGLEQRPLPDRAALANALVEHFGITRAWVEGALAGLPEIASLGD